MFFKDRCLLLRKETGTTVDVDFLGCLKPKAPWRFLNGMGFQDLGGVVRVSFVVCCFLCKGPFTPLKTKMSPNKGLFQEGHKFSNH